MLAVDKCQTPYISAEWSIRCLFVSGWMKLLCTVWVLGLAERATLHAFFLLL